MTPDLPPWPPQRRARGSEPRGRHSADAAQVPTVQPPTVPSGGTAPAAGHPGRPAGTTKAPEWPLLGDDVFRVMHGDNGKLRLDPDIAGLALGTALIAELIFTGFATVGLGRLVAISGLEPIDSVATTVMRQLRAEPAQLPVRDWLTYLAGPALPGGGAYQQIARRLQRAGHVRPQQGLLRRSTRYTPTDANAWAWAWARVSNAVARGLPLNEVDSVLGGLILLTGLHRAVLIGRPEGLGSALRERLDQLGPDVRELMKHAENAIGAAVITGA